MPSSRYLLAPLAACVLLSGCLMNSTRPLPTGGTPSPWRAVVVYGMGIEGDWDYPKLAVHLEEYSLTAQAATGNCMFFNQLQASIPAAPAPVRYVAFDVPAGNYVYSPFNSAALNLATPAFTAPPGRLVYIGDFIYTREKNVVLRRDLETFELARKRALPDLKGEVSLAETHAVAPPRPFICTP